MSLSIRELKSLQWQHYLVLTKPKVIVLMLVTMVIGMFMAQQEINWFTAVFSLLGVALCSASAAVINHVADRHIDKKMLRTQSRPMAQGTINIDHAIFFASLLGVIGWVILLVLVNQLTAYLTLLGVIGYAFIYTFFLKRATPQNIVIGGLAGAIPPLLGWTAMSNEIHPHALLLTLIIFAWTPPHFWALAIHREKEYAKAKIPMLPVTHGKKFTAVFILLYCIILLAVSLLPFAVKMSGIIYIIAALTLGIYFIYLSLTILQNKKHAAIKTFKYSIIYLFALFVAMMVDQIFLDITLPLRS